MSKVAGCNVNVQKWIVYLYTCNEQYKNKIKETILYTIESKIKYLVMNLTK